MVGSAAGSAEIKKEIEASFFFLLFEIELSLQVSNLLDSAAIITKQQRYCASNSINVHTVQTKDASRRRLPSSLAMLPSSPPGPGSSSSDGDSGLIYGLEAQCRALENMPAKEDETAFYVGKRIENTLKRVRN